MSLEDLEEFYWDEIGPQLRRENRSPDQDYPRYQWLVEHGYGGLQRALRRDHNLTLKEFFTDELGVVDAVENDADGYDWGITHKRTIEALEAHLREGEYEQLAESTLKSRRAHLKKFVQTYESLHGSSDVISPLQSVDQKLEETERVRTVAKYLMSELGSERSAHSYLTDVQLWYRDHLLEYEGAVFDPTRKLTNPLDPPEPENAALTAAQVRNLFTTAEDDSERMLVLGLAGWGLRRDEVAALHVSQIQLDVDEDTDEVPFISFESRKNGPSSVSLLYGLETLRNRIAALEDSGGWNGYLFPSGSASTGHIAGTTVWRRVQQLGERAGILIDGEPPKPHQARRFWFREYQQAHSDLLDLAEEIGKEQGSDDPGTIVTNYWSEAERRHHRRRFMRERLAGAFRGENQPR